MAAIKTCEHPDNPEKFYFRVMYREWFFGPFDSEREVIEAVIDLDGRDSSWDYDGVMFIKGASKLPDSYVSGFERMGDDFIERLGCARRVNLSGGMSAKR